MGKKSRREPGFGLRDSGMNYRNLRVWLNSMVLVEKIYAESSKMPSDSLSPSPASLAQGSPLLRARFARLISDRRSLRAARFVE